MITGSTTRKMKSSKHFFLPLQWGLVLDWESEYTDSRPLTKSGRFVTVIKSHGLINPNLFILNIPFSL